MANSSDHMPAAVLITLYALSNLILTTSYAIYIYIRIFCHPYLMDENTGVQRGEATCPVGTQLRWQLQSPCPGQEDGKACDSSPYQLLESFL